MMKYTVIEEPNGNKIYAELVRRDDDKDEVTYHIITEISAGMRYQKTDAGTLFGDEVEWHIDALELD